MAEPLPEMTEITEGGSSAPAGAIRWFGLVLLIGHLGLLVIGAIALWLISGGWWVGAIAAASFVLVYAGLWRYLLAPGSRQRLSYRERLTVNLVAGPVIVVIGSLAGLWLPALVALSIVVLCDALNSR